MQAMTTYDEKALVVLNRIPLWVLVGACKAGNIKLDINNGIITGAAEKQRDYVSVYDGRNMYIPKNTIYADTDSIVVEE